jgi:hypothetical protein
MRQSEKLFIFFFMLLFGVFAPRVIHAHQQPTTIVLLDVSSEKVRAELQIPLSELELAFGHAVASDPNALMRDLQPQFADYLIAHVRATSAENRAWSVAVAGMRIEDVEQTQSGAYREVTVNLVLTPPAGADTRRFVLNYDAVMHQVVTHKALVSIRSDWESGIAREKPVAVGVIGVDTETTKIFPLEVNLDKGGLWTGFVNTIALGMHHIKEGTDHLLFLLVLLLPATLLARGKSWGEFGGARYGIRRVLKIVTAFTAGHSVTLLVGALGWLRLPPQPVEVLIAVSILVSAAHAIRPIFYGREIYIAAGFGLVHGLAFATVLQNLELSAGQMALTILGFNLGIELMQIFIIALVMPWLILLSATTLYKSIKTTGALLASFAAAAWVAERVSGSPNAVGDFAQGISQYAYLAIFALAFLALLAFAKSKKDSAAAE